MKHYFLNISLFQLPYFVVLVGTPLKVQHVDQFASKLQGWAEEDLEAAAGA